MGWRVTSHAPPLRPQGSSPRPWCSRGVEHRGVVALRGVGERGQGVDRGRGGHEVVAVALEHRGEGLAHEGFVFGEEHAGHGAPPCTRKPAKSTVTASGDPPAIASSEHTTCEMYDAGDMIAAVE